MPIFETLFFAGAGGLVLMTLLSFVHGGGHHLARGPHMIGHAGHAGIGGHGGVHALHNGHVGAHGAQGLGKIQDANTSHMAPHAASHSALPASSWLALIPSPIDIFSMCVGAGLAGMLFRSVGYPLIYVIAVLGAIIFDFGAVRPLFAFMLRFASKPSEGLEGTIALSAEAVTKFDEKGQGLVLVNMEGQLVQLLARLDSGDLANGVVVHKGDQVVVTEVDSKSNTCRVTIQLSLQ